MLPVSFQTPAAVILLVGGLLACFAGYRVFRVVLGIYGFILGALLGTAALGSDQAAWMIAAALVGGAIGALIMIGAYFVGVALVGAGVGALAAHAIWASFGGEPHIVVVMGLSIAGALGALALQRYVIIAATAFGGAQTAVVGAAALLGNRPAAEAAARSVFGVYPLNPVPASNWDTVASIALGLAGLAVQLAITAKGRK
jgi:hypothetical protein